MKSAMAIFLAYFMFVGYVYAQGLDQLINDGTIKIVSVSGNGSSSGAALDGYLLNTTTRQITIDVYLRQPIYFLNSGRGQNMIATQIYEYGGQHSVQGGRSFITIPANGQINVMFIAYCADFERDNPTSSERFTIGNMPISIRDASVRIALFEEAIASMDTTVASQVALWIAAGIQPETIRTQFDFSPNDLSVAYQILQ